MLSGAGPRRWSREGRGSVQFSFYSGANCSEKDPLSAVCPSVRPSIEQRPGKKSEIEISKLKTNPRREGGNPNPLASLVSSLVSLSSLCLSVAAGGGFLFCHVPSQVPPSFNHSQGCYLPHAALKPWVGWGPRVEMGHSYISLG